MAFADIEARLTITGFSAGAAATIRAAIKTVYEGSATAKGIFDGWIATAGNVFTVEFVAGAFQALTGTGRIQIDLAELTNANYIDNNGKAVADTAATAILHEFVHALTGKIDNWNNIDDYRGDTVRQSNIIYKELGLPEQNSYIAYDTTGNILTRGRDYTGGAAIDRSVAGDQNWNSGPAGDSKDLLIGGASANTLQSGAGADFLFGAGGNDTLDGGDGSDTIVLTGKPTDYDIRLQADGSYISRHVRGTADEGTDTIGNAERVQFLDGQTFNLAKNGLSFQTDFSFVIDTTGSMFDDIAAVKSAATGVVNALFAGDTIDARINVVTYKDNTNGEPTVVELGFTDQDAFADRKAAALSAINGISVGGGGDFPETAFEGLLKALDGSAGEWRPAAGTKKIALFTDATAKDAFLLPTVLAYATNIGATISAKSSALLGSIGVVDTFELTFGPDDFQQRDPVSEGDDVVSPPLVPFVVTPAGGKGLIQITTIFISGFTTPDPNLTTVSEETGGSVLTASNPAEVVARLLEVITTANFSIGFASSSVTEGNSGTTDVVITISRDRGEQAATVELSVSGTANAGDISGAIPDSVTFAAGELTKDIVIGVRGDTLNEADETLIVTIGDISTPATVLTGEATLDILNDDADAVLVIEGDENNNVLRGTAANEVIIGRDGSDRMAGRGGADVFVFLDSDGPGRDRIADFGSDDVFMSDVKLFDSNGDNIITFGSNLIVDIETSRSVSIFGETGALVRRLEYDGVYFDETTGVEYYIYSRVGSDAGLDTVAGLTI